MAWDDEKEVAPGTEQGELTPDEWNEHVADQKSHSERHESNGDDELSVEGLSGDLADEQDAKPHDIGGATHTADTLANLNSKVSDATLDDTDDPREPEAHAATHEGGSDSLNVFDLTGDLVGEGLERVNDTLQVLSSIWDGTNVVADVNNTNTTTQTLEAEDTSTENLDTDYAYQVRNDESVQDAIDRAEGDGVTTVKIPAGSYDETITVPPTMNVIGQHAQAATSPTVRINPTDTVGSDEAVIDLEGRCKIVGVYARGEDVEGFGFRVAGDDRAIIRECAARDEWLLAEDRCRVYANEVNADITITGNNNAVFGNDNVGTIIDNGSGNETGVNT